MTTFGPKDLGNEDWLKRTWDVRDGRGQPITTLAALRAALPALSDEQLRVLPSMKAAPASLRKELGLS